MFYAPSDVYCVILETSLSISETSLARQLIAFRALTLLVGRREEHPAFKN